MWHNEESNISISPKLGRHIVFCSIPVIVYVIHFELFGIYHSNLDCLLNIKMFLKSVKIGDLDLDLQGLIGLQT